MYYSISCNSITEVYNREARSTFSGSASYSANSVENITTKKVERSATRRAIPTAALISSGDIGSVSTVSPPSDRTYRLNKSKVRKKIDAFFHLQATREFCAFYSITFPNGTSDSDAFTLFNLWQTRCRQTFNLTSFLWVSERQKNGTIHFHLLTNCRMPISQVVAFMRESLLKYCHQYGWDVAKINRYQGIDVDNVWYPKRRKSPNSSQKRTKDEAARHLGKYITKYVSKNNEEFTRRAWHCSRDISALFTAQNFDRCEVTPLLSYFLSTKSEWKVFQSDHFSVYLHPSYATFNRHLDLEAVNETVYSIEHQHVA